jgi:large subunit ribosomal protein L10
MPKSRNINSVLELKDKVAKAKSLVIADYRGMTHKQAEALHTEVKKSGGEFLVVKNSLLRIAAKDSAYAMEVSELTGTNGALFSYEDELAPLKDLFKLVKTTSLPKIKFGFVGGNRYDDKQIDALSKLPGKQQLQAMVVSRMSGPLYGLMYALNGNIQKLVYVLTKIKPKN